MKNRHACGIQVLLGVLLFAGACVLGAAASEREQTSGAQSVLDRYLAMPQPGTPAPDARLARLEVLDQLGREADALAVIRRAWPGLKDPRQRVELTEMVGRRIQTREGATMLTEWLKDPSENVRWQAVHGLRLLARRTDRIGGQRTVRGPDQPPKVAGLVPALITAANDSSDKVRVNAMYALADTRDPQATAELKKHLRDPSAEVRLRAACLLTEFQDAAGLPELIGALERLKTAKPETDVPRYFEAEMLLASLERITRRTEGEIPMNPDLSSDTREAEALRARYETLIRAWSDYLGSPEGRRQVKGLEQEPPGRQGSTPHCFGGRGCEVGYGSPGEIRVSSPRGTRALDRRAPRPGHRADPRFGADTG